MICTPGSWVHPAIRIEQNTMTGMKAPDRILGLIFSDTFKLSLSEITAVIINDCSDPEYIEKLQIIPAVKQHPELQGSFSALPFSKKTASLVRKSLLNYTYPVLAG